MSRKTAPARPQTASRAKSGETTGKAHGLLIRVNPEGLKAVRMLAAELDMTIQALGIEAWNDLLQKHGRRSALKNPLLPGEGP